MLGAHYSVASCLFVAAIVLEILIHSNQHCMGAPLISFTQVTVDILQTVVTARSDKCVEVRPNDCSNNDQVKGEACNTGKGLSKHAPPGLFCCWYGYVNGNLVIIHSHYACMVLPPT